MDWAKQVSKTDYARRLLNELKSQVTRCKRGSNEKDLLLRDLEIAEKTVARIDSILSSEKEFYSEYEIEQLNIADFLNAIKQCK